MQKTAKKLNSKHLIQLVAGIILAGMLIYLALTKFLFLPPASPHVMPDPQVTVQEITFSDVPLSYEYAGKVAGFKEVEVRAQVGGILKNKSFVEGQFVKAGDILFTIEPQNFQAALEKAKAHVNEANAAFLQNEKAWKRVDELFKKEAVSAQEHDNALAGFKQSKASVEQAEANLKEAQIQLDYCQVIAPISGVIGKESYSVGNLITSGILTSITQSDPIYINFAYSENEYQQLSTLKVQEKLIFPEDNKLKVIVKLADNSNFSYEGNVDFTDSVINHKTSTIAARALVNNPEGKLLPGQFVRIMITGLKWKKATVIPGRSIIYTPGGTMVYVVGKDKKVSIKPVFLGPQIGSNFIIDKGLDEGEQIITEGMIKVQVDQIVNVTNVAKSAIVAN